MRRQKTLTYTGLLASALLASCATVDRLNRFPAAPQIYGGTRTYDQFYEFKYETPRDELGTLYGLDRVGTILFDTLLLPVTIPAELCCGSEEETPPPPHRTESSTEDAADPSAEEAAQPE